MSVRCGNKKAHDGQSGHHDTVAQVRLCYQITRRLEQEEWEEQQQANAEMEAERRNERWFEDRGAMEPEDPREIEARMMEDEARWAAEIQAKERADDERAYTAKMRRDEESEARQALDRMAGHGSTIADPVSDKQVRYALDLLDERVWPDSVTEDDLRAMERRQVSKLISGLLSSPRKPKDQHVRRPLAPEVGMYWANGSKIVRIYFGQRSGVNLAKVIVERGSDENGVTYGYQYLGSAERLAAGGTSLGRVKLARMTLEEAQEWGRATRSCVVCGRRLDVPESVDAGIGPVCASRGAW